MQVNGQRPPRRWFALLASVLALAVGIFLLVFPWITDWSLNYVQEYSPYLEERWQDPVFRSGISCLGVLNLLISYREARRALPRTP